MALTRAAKTKGIQLYTSLMGDKALDDAALDRHLAEVGLDPKAARKDAEHPLIDRQILDTHALAEALKIDGTLRPSSSATLMIPGAGHPRA